MPVYVTDEGITCPFLFSPALSWVICLFASPCQWRAAP